MHPMRLVAIIALILAVVPTGCKQHSSEKPDFYLNGTVPLEAGSVGLSSEWVFELRPDYPATTGDFFVRVVKANQILETWFLTHGYSKDSDGTFTTTERPPTAPPLMRFQKELMSRGITGSVELMPTRPTEAGNPTVYILDWENEAGRYTFSEVTGDDYRFAGIPAGVYLLAVSDMVIPIKVGE